jgi:hypothetical protein
MAASRKKPKRTMPMTRVSALLPPLNVARSLGISIDHHLKRSESDLRYRRYAAVTRHGHSRQAYGAGLALAEWLCRTADRIDPARVRGPFCRHGGGASAPDPASLCWLLQRHQNASVIGQRCAGHSPRSADWNHKFTPDPWRASPPLCQGLGFWHTQDVSGQFLSGM